MIEVITIKLLRYPNSEHVKVNNYYYASKEDAELLKAINGKQIIYTTADHKSSGIEITFFISAEKDNSPVSWENNRSENVIFREKNDLFVFREDNRLGGVAMTTYRNPEDLWKSLVMNKEEHTMKSNIYYQSRREIMEMINWTNLRKLLNEAKPEVDEYDGKLYKRMWIANSMVLAPSGKVWAFWTDNANEEEQERDEAFWEAFEDLVPEILGEGVCLDFEDGEVYIVQEVEDES